MLYSRNLSYKHIQVDKKFWVNPLTSVTGMRINPLEGEGPTAGANFAVKTVSVGGGGHSSQVHKRT